MSEESQKNSEQAFEVSKPMKDAGFTYRKPTEEQFIRLKKSNETWVRNIKENDPYSYGKIIC